MAYYHPRSGNKPYYKNSSIAGLLDRIALGHIPTDAEIARLNLPAVATIRISQAVDAVAIARANGNQGEARRICESTGRDLFNKYGDRSRWADDGTDDMGPRELGALIARRFGGPTN